MENKQYIVTINGRSQTWDADKYTRNEKSLKEKYPDSIVQEVSGFADDEQVRPDGSYLITIGDQQQVWNGEKLNRNKAHLQQKYPNATIGTLTTISAPQQVDSSMYFPSPLSEEGKADVQPISAEERSKQEYDMLMRHLNEFNAANGDMMDTYEAYEKAAMHQVNEGGFAIDTPERRYLDENSSTYHQRKMEKDELNSRIKNNSYFNQMRMAEADAANETVDAISNLMAQNEAENSELHKKMKAMNALAMNPRGSFSGFAKTKEMQEYMDERADLETAKRLYENTAQVYAAPINDGEDILKKFGKGFGQRVDDADFWSMGIVGIADDMNARAAFQKIQDKFGSVKEFANLTDAEIDALLTPSEQLLISAVMDNNAALYARKDNTAGAYQAGAGAADSLMFMAQFLLTGGIGDAATVGTAAHKRLVNWLGRKVGSLGNGLMKDVARGAVKLGVGTAESIGKALVMTPLMPHTYANIADKMMSFDDNGELMDTTDAIISGSIDALIETWSESTGDFVNKILGVPGDITKGIAKKALKNVDFSDWGKAMNAPMMKILRKGGFNGFLGEMGEEFIGNATRSLVGTLAPGSGQDPEALKNFAQWEQLLVTAGSFAPMTIFGLGVSGAQYGWQKRQLNNAQKAFESMLREASYTEDQTKFIIDELLGSTDAHLTPERLVANFSPLLRELAFNDRFANNRTQAMQSAVDFMWEIARYRTFDGVYHRQEEQQRNDMLAEIQEGTGREFWTTRLSENAGLDGTAYETDEVRAVEFNDGRVAYVLGGDGVNNTVVYNDGQTGFLSEEQLNEGKANGSIVSDATMSLNDYLTQQVARVRMTEEEQRMFSERGTNIGEVRAQFPMGATVQLGTTEAPIEGVVRQQTPDGAIVESPAGISMLTWEELGHTIGVEVNPQTDAQMEEEAINNLEIADLQRRREREQRRTQRNAAAEAVLTEEQLLDEAENEGLENPIPTKADGSVDQTAFWNESPARWAQWKTEQRQDGGAYASSYIQNAIGILEGQIAANEEAFLAESDFDAKDAIEQTINQQKARLAELQDLAMRYMPSVIPAETSAEATAEQTQPSSETSQPTAVMADRQKFELDAEYQRRLSLAKALAEKEIILKEYFEAISAGSMEAVVMNKQNYKQIMKENGCDEAAIERVTKSIKIAEEVGQAVSALHANDKIFVIAEYNYTVENGRVSYVHERQHNITKRNPELIQRVLSLGLSRETLQKIVRTLSGTAFYDNESDEVLADEILSSTMEIAYTFDDFSVTLSKLGLPIELINLINQINDEQRNDFTLANARRNAIQYDNPQDNSGQNVRDQGEVSGGILGEKGNGSLGDSDRRAEAGGEGERRETSLGEGGAEASEEGLQVPVAEVGEESGEKSEGPDFRVTKPEDNLSDETKQELADKGLIMDGGVIMSNDYAELKHETGYLTPIEEGATTDEVRFSVVTMPGWKQNYLKYQDADKRIVRVLEAFADRITANELVNGVIAQGKHKSSKKTKDGRLVETGPLRSNISYVVTFDLDTTCPRTFQYLNYVRRIERRIGRPLTQIECIQLNEMMRMYGQQIPCVYCYAENKRQAMKQYFNNYIESRHAVLSAETDEEALKHMYGHEAEGTDPKTVLTEAAYKVFKKWRKNPKGTYNPTMRVLWHQYDQARNSVLSLLDMRYAQGAIKTDAADETLAKMVAGELGVSNKTAVRAIEEIVVEWKWNTIEGVAHDDFTRMDEDDLWANENALEVWRDMTLYAKSASGAKNVNRYVPYTDELKNVDQATRDYINGMGGLRMHSTNDFRIDYVFDYFQFLADMAAAKMFGHTYTKSPEFVRIFGNSGYKINMSIAAYQDENGVIRPNVDEGFDWNEAKELRRLFPNAGTMLMATSDEQLQMALDSDWIDMCIPFHHSGLPKAVWYNMRLWTDYTTVQNERYFNNDERIAMLAEAGVELPKKISTENVEEIFNEHFGIKVEYGTDGKRVKPHFLPGPTIVKGVKIPGHNNDHQEYLRLCKMYGVKPRFEGIKVKDNTPEGGGRIVDITEHPRYMILVKETARTDTPQTAIQFNFDQPSEALGGKSPMDYAFDELEARAMAESDLAGEKVRDIYTSLKQDQFGIVEQFLNTIIKHKEETGEDYPMDYLTPESREWFLVQRKAFEEAFKDIKTIPYHRNEYDEQGNLTKGKGLEREEGTIDLVEEAKKAQAKHDVRLRVAEQGTLVPGHKKGQSMVPQGEELDTISFRITKNTKSTIEKWCDQVGLEENIKEGFVTHLEYTFDDTTEQLCAAKWYLNGKINLPNEDEQKVKDAVKVAKQNKVDAFSYDSPMDIINRYGKPKEKVKPINPDTVPTLTNKVEVPGTEITIYDVDESRESQENMRKIINTHYGKDSSPWCLLQGDGEGNLSSQAEHYWHHYSATKKRVAFHKGRLQAFYATSSTGQWWDRNDVPHLNIPVVKDMENDALKRKRQYEYAEDGQITLAGNMFKGNKKNGEYIEWEVSPNYGEQIARVQNWKDGKPEGMWKNFYSDGSICSVSYYEGGVQVSAMQFGNKQVWASFLGGERHNIKAQVYFSDSNSIEVVITDYNRGKQLKLIGADYAEGALLSDPIYKAVAEYFRSLYDEAKPNYGLSTEDAETTLDTIIGWAKQEQMQEAVSFRISNENQAIFVSNAAKAVEGIQMGKATPEQWLKMIEKNGGLKAGEDKWMGLSDFLKSSDKKTLTKQEVLDFINENMIVIEEQHYGEIDEEEATRLAIMNDVARGYSLEELQEMVDENAESASRYDDEAEDEDFNLDSWLMDRMVDEFGDDFSAFFTISGGYIEQTDPHWWERDEDAEVLEDESGVRQIHAIRADYTTSGLKNNHEIALTIPIIEPWNVNDNIHFGDAGEGRAIAWIRFGETKRQSPEVKERIAEFDVVMKEMMDKYGYDYESSLTGDDLIRHNTAKRNYFETLKQHPSKKVLVIDEIQSNRHQEGRERGYARMTTDQFIDRMNEKYGTKYYGWQDKATPEELEEYRAFIKSVPDAPFDKNWHELAMKRMLRYAAENGYDAIAWTTGDQQARRYDLSRDVKRISVSIGNDGSRIVNVYYRDEYDDYKNMLVDSEGKVTSGDYQGNALADVVGKEMALQIMNATESTEFKGEGLKIGGEGMRGFYDKMLPSFMNKYGKKWGVKVEDLELPNLGKSGYTMHSVPVTEEMKASVMEGQVMFRMRSVNESAMDFTQSEVDAYYSKYNNLAETIVSQVNEEVAREHGYTLEELKKIYGVYESEKDRITIFAHEENYDGDKVETSLFHESIHKLAEFYPYLVKAGEWMYNNADRFKTFAEIKDIIVDEYEPEWHHEEMLCYVISACMNVGVVEEVMTLMPQEHKRNVEQILKEIGYDTTTEGGSRKARRSISESAVSEDLRNAEGKGEGGRSSEEAKQDLATNEQNGVVSFRITPEVQDELNAIKASALVMGNFMKAPNGKESNLNEEQWLLVRTKGFKSWFGDWLNDPENASKVVDENGEPLVVYHGTNDEFDTFGEKPSQYGRLGKVFGEGHYFSSSKEVATQIANRLKAVMVDGKRVPVTTRIVIPAFLNIRDMVDIEGQQDWKRKYQLQRTKIWNEKSKTPDGLVVRSIKDGVDIVADTYLVYDANNIKSATNNNGEFSKENDDVRFRTSMELDQEFGAAWRDQQNEDGRHSTQVANTKSTYEKIGNWMKSAGLEGASILDASSGLGLGTQALREMGFQVDDVEPFPSENREAPTFASYDSIDGKYDVVISNAVLNVIPDDWRADVLHKMASVVKDGGKIIINTRPASNISKQGVEGKTRITLDSPSEILVKRGDRIAAYQKGFTSEELAEWIESELGEGWRVEKATKKNSGISGEGTAVVIKEGEPRFRVTGTPTEDVVAEGVSLSKKDLANLAGDIFAALDEEGRKKITDGLNGNLLGLQDAILQIPTSLAVKEEWNDEDKAMAEVVAEQMTKAVGKEMTRPFSASEALWTLYNAVNKSTDLVSEASRALVKRNLGFGPETLEMENQAREDVRFRTVGDASINATASLYNKGARNAWTRLKESFIDMNASVEELVKAIEKASGKVAQGFENILMALNQQSSKGLAAMESYQQKFLEPMFKEISEIMKKTGKKYQDVVRYVILKHGLERNDKMAKRDAREFYRAEFEQKVAAINADKSLTDAEKQTKTDAAQKELDQHMMDIDWGVDAKYKELRERDYSGISSMFYDQLGVNRADYATEEEYQAALMDAKKDKYPTLADVEQAAYWEVTDFEHDTSTDELWRRINAATKETLRQQYQANMISKDQYETLKGMFDFYVPLRGFADNTAEDMYTYYRKPNSTGYTKPILGAEGRKTEAESPFGWIASMAGSAIASNVKNEAKLALYYFVSNRPGNGIATISKTWYVQTGVDADGKKIFSPTYPPFTDDLSSDAAKQAYEDWQQQMRDLRAKGQAYESGQRLNLGNSVVNIDTKNRPEHVVNVKVGGKDYTILINGNPRAAQAINGDLNIESTASDYSALFGPVLRWMSSVNTSYNPEFWITNMMRDMLFTTMAINVKEDKAYRRRFSANYWKAFKVVSMVAKNEKGTLGNSYIEDMYKDFVENGGVTGYTQIKDSETWEKEIENYMKSDNSADTMKGVAMQKLHAFHRFGESLEQVSRFAAFLTSREMGKPMAEAINDAKEITVNFNRKGSGKMISFDEAKQLTDKNGKPLNKVEQYAVVVFSSMAPLGRRFIMFFNAAIQGLNAMQQLYKKNPSKLRGWLAGYAALGMMNAVLHAMLDDDDDYLDIPQYERRNSLMVGAKGVYVKWALPQEARAFYALGDLAVETIMGRNPHQNAAVEAAKIMTEILPINPTEGWKAFLPSVAVPFVELGLNEDYKGAPIYNEQKWLSEEERKRTAKWSKAYQNTGKVYIHISKMLNNLTGGDAHDAGFINIQPEVMEHLVQSAFGGTVRTADKIVSTVLDWIDPEEKVSIRQFPFLNRILTLNDERFKNVHVNDVYEFYEAEAIHAKNLDKKYKKDKDKESLDNLRKTDAYKSIRIYGRYKKPIKNLQEKIKAAEGTAERKELMKQQDELKKRMIKEISEL